jgi:hypothetical protein
MANYSNALKRVLARKVKLSPDTPKVAPMEGVYLSNEQLIKLSQQLANNGSDGVCFMIGKKVGNNNLSVEIIPFKHENNTLKFFESGGIIGNILARLGSAFGHGRFIITNDGYDPNDFTPVTQQLVQHFGADAPHEGSSSQRTPPPGQ